MENYLCVLDCIAIGNGGKEKFGPCQYKWQGVFSGEAKRCEEKEKTRALGLGASKPCGKKLPACGKKLHLRKKAVATCKLGA